MIKQPRIKVGDYELSFDGNAHYICIVVYLGGQTIGKISDLGGKIEAYYGGDLVYTCKGSLERSLANSLDGRIILKALKAITIARIEEAFKLPE